MTGLILKDFYTMKKTLIYLGVVILGFTAFYTGLGDSHFSDFFISIMVVSIITSTLSYDEYYRWDRYAAILPVSRRQMVGAKYLLTLVLFGVGGVLSLGLTVAITSLQGRGYGPEDFAISGAALLVGLIGASVVIPCCYRYGAQKSRFVMVAFYGIPALILVAGLKFAPGLMDQVTKVQIGPVEFALGALAVTAAVLAGSFLLSVRIMERKELK